MGKAAQRRFESADDQRTVGIETADNVAVDRHRAVRAFAVFAAGGVGVVVALALGDGVMRHHAVDVAGGNHKAQPGLAELGEIAVGSPIGLRQKGDAALSPQT